jgi:hypothetical protein
MPRNVQATFAHDAAGLVIDRGRSNEDACQVNSIWSVDGGACHGRLAWFFVELYARAKRDHRRVARQAQRQGVLSDDEYQALKKAREEERLEQRAERRRQAVKAAQDTEKEEKAKQAHQRSTSIQASAASSCSAMCGCATKAATASSSFAIPGTAGAFDWTRTAGVMPRGSAFAGT